MGFVVSASKHPGEDSSVLWFPGEVSSLNNILRHDRDFHRCIPAQGRTSLSMGINFMVNASTVLFYEHCSCFVLNLGGLGEGLALKELHGFFQSRIGSKTANQC